MNFFNLKFNVIVCRIVSIYFDAALHQSGSQKLNFVLVISFI
jgi:chemotaxis methyl-accepting protein methylase